MSKNIVVLSTNDFGGAGESAFRITRGLRDLGHQALLLVQHKLKSEDFVTQINEKPTPPQPLAVRISRKVYDKVQQSVARLTDRELGPALRTDSDYYFFNTDEAIGLRNITSLMEAIPFQPDLILVGWVSGFINTCNMQDLGRVTQAPVYWITTDMAPLTGGCHYAWDCPGYTRDCANCPAILTEEFKQLARRNLALKTHHVQEGKIRVMAGSEWCRRQAAASTLFGHQLNIPVLNGLIDQKVFNDRSRFIAKQVFGVATTDKLVFTGATFTHEKRKGIEYLVTALQQLYARLTTAEQTTTRILVAGNNVLENELIKQIPFGIVPIDFIKDDRLLSLAYQAADLFVCSSIEDSGPMMVNEALACGTPVVGFELGFVADIVEHGQNGFRVPLKNTQLMAEYMQAVLALSPTEAAQFSRRAIRAIDEKVSLQKLHEVITQLTN
ncbi:glycosyl transferase group 1 [Hymenobacter roseosalivarius DSM 11622]|uniref:Glycosyl transferase group 1 n=1 Tax=Hymenobacter roseosalivarius DSM 11622 TaxID=645990 RepID=A0A1W1V869_9BACT|nr:glycosyltransferase [Hymenobacter roseosalivarius]SMB89436.1 glycosyl transferase group 1 [Hymenobacter roseosalivarius DSM 11622]